MDDHKCGAIEALLLNVEQALALADDLKLTMAGIRLNQAIEVLVRDREAARLSRIGVGTY